MWCYDAFELYTRGLLTNANMLVAGEPGSGKSAAVKTYLYRTLALYGAGGVRRWAAIVDPKREYLDLAEKIGHAGSRALPRWVPIGSIRLMPVRTWPGLNRDELVRRRTELVRALMEVMLYRPLNGVEDGAISWTLDLLTATPSPPWTRRSHLFTTYFGFSATRPMNSVVTSKRRPARWTSRSN